MNGSPEQPGTMQAESRPPAPREAPGQAPAPQPPQAGGEPSPYPPRVERYEPSDPRRKSPVLACILSLMPGLGQIYVGYYRLGFIHAVVFAGTIAMLSLELEMPVPPLLGIFLAFFYLYNIVDAGRRAAFYNQALAGVEGVELPAEMGLPSPGGSMAGGIVLIVVGLILLSNTAAGYSLKWLEDWWPLAPIALGCWLVARSLQERAEKD